jgi:mRNA-degrading endonuclease RelE of RelBE toxin-antitoxin system
LKGWIPDRRPTFSKQFKELDSKTQKRVKDAVMELLAAENPARLGVYKQDMRIFAYNIGKKHRILYNVNWNDNTIEFLRVCDHKSAYGKD